jgi:hypothetical protein
MTTIHPSLLAKQDAVALLNALSDIASYDPDLKVIVATREAGVVHCKPYQSLIGPDMYTGYDKPTVDNYVCVMATRSHADGTVGRKKDDFRAGLCLMVDDLGTGAGSHFPLAMVTSVLEPSALVETSPNNFQAIYFFDKPLYDRHSFNTLIKAFIHVVFSGQDPGQDDINRIFRIPFGTNSKYEAKPKVLLRKLNPGLRYSPKQIYDAFNLELYKPEYERLQKLSLEKHARIRDRQHNGSDDEASFAEALNEFAANGHLRYNGELQDAVYDPHYVVDCPWWEEHSDHSDTQRLAKLFPPGVDGSMGRLYCHHSSCKARARSQGDGNKDSYHPLDGVERMHVKLRPPVNLDLGSIIASSNARAAAKIALFEELRTIVAAVPARPYGVLAEERKIKSADVIQIPTAVNDSVAQAEREVEDQLINEYLAAKLSEPTNRQGWMYTDTGFDTAHESADVDWIWHSYIPRNTVNFLYGGSFGGKTFLAMELAHCVQNGQQFMSTPTVKTGVLHIFSEGRDTAVLRMRAVESSGRFEELIHIGHTNDEPANLNICPNPEYRNDPTGKRYLSNAREMESALGARRFIKKHNIGLVVLDTLSASAEDDFDENDNNKAAKYIRKVRRWARWCGVAVLIIHHTGKGEGQDMRGASALRANVDGVFYLVGEAQNEDGAWIPVSVKDGSTPERRTLKCEKAKSGTKLTKIGEVGEFEIIDVTFGKDAFGCEISSGYSQYIGYVPRVSKAAGRKIAENLLRQPCDFVLSGTDIKTQIICVIDYLHSAHPDQGSFTGIEIRNLLNAGRESNRLSGIPSSSMGKPLSELCKAEILIRDGSRYLKK